MADDIRTALNLPGVVATNLGAVAVHELSARETVVSIQKLTVLALAAQKEMGINDTLNWMTAMFVVFQKYPDQVLAVLEPTTDLEKGKLGDVNMAGLFGIIAVVVELHEEAIENFFVARAAVDKVMGRIAARKPRSQKSSISSSDLDGATQTSNGSHSDKSEATHSPPSSEQSEIASEG